MVIFYVNQIWHLREDYYRSQKYRGRSTTHWTRVTLTFEFNRKEVAIAPKEDTSDGHTSAKAEDLRSGRINTEFRDTSRHRDNPRPHPDLFRLFVILELKLLGRDYRRLLSQRVK